MANRPRTCTDDWIAAGYEALRREGLAGVRVGAIAAELGVSRAGFYHRFADRDALVEAVLDHWWGLAGQLHAAVLEQVDDPEGRLRGFGAAVLCHDELREADGWLLLHDPLEPSFAERARTSRTMVEEWVTGILGELGFDSATASRRAYSIYTGYLGLLADIESRPERPTDAEIRARFDDLVDLVLGDRALGPV